MEQYFADPTVEFQDAIKAALTNYRSKIIIAQQAGVSTNFVSRVINGRCIFKANDPRLISIAYVIGFPRERIFGEPYTKWWSS